MYLKNTGFIMRTSNRYIGAPSFKEVILMNTISEIRLSNARNLAAECNNLAEFSRIIDREPTQVSRFMGANPTKNIGDRIARHIETKCGKPKGWLDTDNSTDHMGVAFTAIPDDYEKRILLSVNTPLIEWNQIIMADECHRSTLIPCPADHGPNTFATRVKDNTMTAQYGRSYPEGSIIYIDPDRAHEAQPGDRVFAIIEGKIPSFKLYGEADGERYLQSINLQYPIITREFEIKGLVIGMWMPEH
jgi:SOS-response transcriptional repressor LexA